MHVRGAPAIVLCSLIALAGCSSSSQSDADADNNSMPPASTTPASSTTPAPTPSPTTTTQPDDLRAAVQAYSDAFLTGDSDVAYSLLTDRCRARTDESTFADIVAAAAVEYGSALPMKSYEADVNGDQARVTYTYADSSIDQQQEPWARESGAWHNDDC